MLAGAAGAAAGAAADAGADASVPLSSRARPVLTHCQVLGDDLIARMAALGVVANIQPSFVPTDARFVSQRLAASVHRTSYAWRSLLAAGVWCAGGSDAPVELPWPLLGMHDAMARAARPEGGGAAERSAAPAACDIFLPEERLDSLFEAVVVAVTTAPGLARHASVRAQGAPTHRAPQPGPIRSLTGHRASCLTALRGTGESVPPQVDLLQAALRCGALAVHAGRRLRHRRGGDARPRL